MIFSQVFSTEVRAIIKLVFTEQQAPCRKTHFHLSRNDVFSRDLNTMFQMPAFFLKRIWREPPFACGRPPGLNYSSKDWSRSAKKQKIQSMILWILTTPRSWDSLNSHLCLGSQFMISINKKLIFFPEIWIRPSCPKLVASIFERHFRTKLNL